jgi:hypothetical protein
MEIAKDEECPETIRRLAGFDAVRILDSLGRFRESLELANRFHRSFTGQDATQHLLEHLDLQLDGILKGAFSRRQLDHINRMDHIHRISILVGLPRSGTTLLGQMLDNHPEIQAIGEFDGLKEIIHTMTSQNVSPYQLLQLDERSVEALRGIYRDGARRFIAEGMPWTVDKSLLNWTSLPFLVQLLPGARYIYIRRDPRDLAVSLLLSWFDYEQFPWVSKLSDLYQVIFRSHALLPKCLNSFGVEYAEICYEELASNPIPAIGKCLNLLDLKEFAGTLSPENNLRPVNTLSFDQVKRPLYQDSIGRWKNYEWLFDGDWHRLAESAGY